MNNFICENCGKEVSDNDKVCPGCGVIFIEDEETKAKSNSKIIDIDYTSSSNFVPYSTLGTITLFCGLFTWIFCAFSSILTIGLILTVIFGIIFIAVKSNYDSQIKEYSNSRDDFIDENSDKYSYIALTLDLKGICIDEKKKEVLVFNGSLEDYRTLKFKDILSFELWQNGNKEIEGKGLRTLAVGELFGTSAAIASAAGKRNINEFCNELIIYIYTESINEYDVELAFINGVRLSKNDDRYLNLYSFAKGIITTLDKVMNIKKKSNSNIKRNNKKTTKNTNKKTSTSKYDELEKLKELLDKGIITKKEFNDEKKKILNK